jgi:uncharacterized damage-inducible protein DinB
MSHTAVTLEALLGDFEATTAKWKNFFAENPGAAEVTTDIAGSSNIAALVWHICGVSLRHSQRLLGEPVSDLEAEGPVKNLAAAWESQARAVANLHRFLETTTEAALDETFEFQTRSAGMITGSRRKLCLHVFVHAIRHWAQIATLARQNGFPPRWGQDIFFSEAIR